MVWQSDIAIMLSLVFNGTKVSFPVVVPAKAGIHLISSDCSQWSANL